MNPIGTQSAALLFLGGMALAAMPANASTVIPAAFDSRSESDGDPSPTNATISDLAVGPVSAGRSFRTYLTFDLSGAPTLGGGDMVELVLRHTSSSGNPNEGNTSTLQQDFILFSLASDWDGGPGAGPLGTDIDAVTLTPTANHAEDLIFSGAGLASAYNSAVGGNLYLGIRSSAENADARSFVWYGSVEDGPANQPFLNVIPEPSVTLLGGLGLLAMLRRRR